MSIFCQFYVERLLSDYPVSVIIFINQVSHSLSAQPSSLLEGGRAGQVGQFPSQELEIVLPKIIV